MGKNIFHPNLIIWSYRYLGKVALNHKNKNMNANVLIANQTNPGRDKFL